MAFKPQERAAAIAEGKIRYFTGRKCKHGHVAERRVSNGCCVICEENKYKKWLANNPDKAKESWKKSYAKNAEANREYAKQYRLDNLEKCRESARKSKLKNRAYHTRLQVERDKRMKQAKPDWLTAEDIAKIQSIYDASKELKDSYGIECAVDHIIPIKGKTVCGLHTPNNLRIVSKSYNSQISNKLTDDIPEYQSTNSIMLHASALPWNLQENTK